MLNYVLIWIVVSTSGVATGSAYFPNEQACKQVQFALEDVFLGNLTTVCVHAKSGEPK